MILIDCKTGLSVEESYEIYKGKSWVHFQVQNRENWVPWESSQQNRENGGPWESSEQELLLPSNAIEPFVAKLKEAKEALARIKDFKKKCTIILGEEHESIEIGDETYLHFEVSQGWEARESFVHLKLKRKYTDPNWRTDIRHIRVPANAINHLIFRLNQARENLGIYEQLEMHDARADEKKFMREQSQQLVARTEEKILQLLDAGPKSKSVLMKSTQAAWESLDLELFSYEQSYASAIEDLIKKGEIHWNKEKRKWELNSFSFHVNETKRDNKQHVKKP